MSPTEASDSSFSVPATAHVSLSRLMSVFDEALRVSDEARRPNGHVVPPPTAYRVLSICGHRGAGKTTLLNRFVSSLANRPDVVPLAPIEPEMFGPADTIFSAVIAKLQATLERMEGNPLADTNVRASGPLGLDGNLALALDRLLRHAALMHGGDGAREVRQSSLDQYSSDFAKQALTGEGFTDLWDATVIAYCQALARDSSRTPSLLIPVDDVDLVPHFLARLLQDIRVLAKTPHVVVCICLDPSEARDILSADYVRSLGLTAMPVTAHSIVEAQLSKVLPRQRRVVLDDLTQLERLSFTPLDSSGRPPLSDLLSQFTFETSEQLSESRESFTLERLFWLTEHDGTRPSPYAECLPAVPRDLENLYFALTAALGEEGLPDISEAAKTIVESAVHDGYQRTPNRNLDPEILFRIERSSDARQKPRLLLDFSPLGYARHATSSLIFRLNDQRGLTVAFAALSSIVGTLEDSDGNNSKQRVHPSLTLGLLLAREFTQYAEIFDEEIGGGEPIAGGRNGGFLNFHVGPQRADEGFLILPAWRAYYDYFAFDFTWRAALRDAEQASKHLDEHPSTLVAGLIVSFQRLVAETQIDRQPQQIDTSVLGELSEGSAEALRAEWKRARIKMEEAGRIRSGATHRVEAFRDWLNYYMPMALHPWLLPDPLIEEALEMRAEMLGTGASSNYQLDVYLHQRIRANLGEDWITPLFDIFERLPGVNLKALSESHQRAVHDREQMLALGASIPPRTATSTSEGAQVSPTELGQHAIAILRTMIDEEVRRAEAR